MEGLRYTSSPTTMLSLIPTMFQCSVLYSTMACSILNALLYLSKFVVVRVSRSGFMQRMYFVVAEEEESHL